MAITLMLSAVLMAAIFWMILVAVALVRDRRLFATAPKDVQAVIKDRPKRFLTMLYLMQAFDMIFPDRYLLT